MDRYETIDLEGKIIKEMFKKALRISMLHNVLASNRGNHFRRKLLQALEVEKNSHDIEKLRSDAGLGESQRHLHKLLEFNLIKEVDPHENQPKKYIRTPIGEVALNALRALEREVGGQEVEKIFSASLGLNSVKLFLRIYGQKKECDIKTREVKYTPAEIGRLSLFLPRNIEGIAAIDKLSDAEMLVYKEDGFIYLDPKKARSFYKYLRELNEIIK